MLKGIGRSWVRSLWFALRLALDTKYQDKFWKAHDALFGVISKLTEPRLRYLLAGAGIDFYRLDGDLAGYA